MDSVTQQNFFSVPIQKNPGEGSAAVGGQRYWNKNMTAVNPLWGGVAGRERHVSAPREWALKKWPNVSVMPLYADGETGTRTGQVYNVTRGPAGWKLEHVTDFPDYLLCVVPGFFTAWDTYPRWYLR